MSKEKKEKKEKAVKVSDKEAETTVLEYLNRNNRPYNALQVFENLHGGVGKTQAVKVLQALADKGQIVCKENGKQKVFWKNQDDEGVDPDALQELEKRMNSLEEELEQVSAECKSSSDEVRALTTQLTGEQLEAELTRLEAENERLETKLAGLKNSSVKISDEDRKKAEQRYSYARSMWSKRKRLFRDIMSTIEESSGKSSKELYEELAIETDEERGVSMGDDIVTANKRAKK